MGRMLQVICGVVVAMGLSSHPGKAQSRQDGAASAERVRAPVPIVGQNQTGQTDASEQGRQEKDLAAQKAMASAAVGQLGEVRTQTWLLGFSVALGGIALIVSGAALIVTIGTGRRELRAYLIATPRHITVQRVPEGSAECVMTIAIRFEVDNAGATPAYRVGVIGRIEQAPWPMTEPIKSPADDDGRDFNVVVKGEPRPITLTQDVHLKIHDLLSEAERLHLSFRVTYMDVFKRKRTFTGYSTVVSKGLNEFIRTGGVDTPIEVEAVPGMGTAT